MAEKKVSLLIVARDAATAVVRATGAAIGKVAAGIASAFKFAGKSVIAINQGLELVRKVLGAVGAAYSATVGKALEMRAASDSARKDMEAFAKAGEGLQVAVGDALIPVVQALAQALTPVIKAATEWFDKNRQLIGSNIITWLTKLATVFVDVLAPAMQTVLFIGNGLYQAFKIQFELIGKLVKYLVGGIVDALGIVGRAISTVANAAGLDSLAAKFSGLGSGIKDTFAEVGDSIKEGIVYAWDSTPGVKAIGEIAQAAREGIGKVASQAVDNFANRVIKAAAAMADLEMRAAEAWGEISTAMADFIAKDAQGKIAKDADALASSLRTVGTEYERLAKNAESTDALQNGLADLRKQYGAAADAAFKATGSIAGASDALAEQSTKLETVRDGVTSVIGSVGSAFKTMIMSAIEGTQSAGDVIGAFFSSIGESILDTLINIAVQSGIGKILELVLGTAVRKAAITGLAAEAGAAAYASIAAIPIVGPLLAPAAAEMAYNNALAFGGRGLAEGGLVRGGRMGEDSVRALLMPGELVTPYKDVQRNVSQGRAPGDSGLPRRGERRGGDVNVTIASMFPPSRAELRRNVNQGLVPEIAHARKTGRLK